MSISFQTFSFDGKPVKQYTVDKIDLGGQQSVPVKVPVHHILIVDRSGSMYGAMADLRQTLEKVLTLSEFADPTLKFSLLSYSSQGDLKTHFTRSSVSAIMEANSSELKEIRGLHVTGLTCISQGLIEAAKLVTPGEVTAITLHSDGYANDISPSSEARQIKSAVEALKALPGVFCNTIAYGSYCDFNMLTGIANALSGACLQAKDIRAVFTAIQGTTAMLAGNIAPAKEANLDGANLAVFLSRKDKKLLGSTQGFMVQGLSADADATLFRYREVPVGSVPVNPDVTATLAFARSQVALGNLQQAKLALAGKETANFLRPHARALVVTDVAAFASDLDEAIFEGKTLPAPQVFDGLVSGQVTTLTEVLSFLGKHKDGFQINLDDFRSRYVRRGVRRVTGTRDENGNLVKPDVDQKVTEKGPWVSVSGFQISQNAATINMLVSQAAQLVRVSTGEVIEEVAGIPLKLRTFNNYTLVGDGQINAPSLRIKAWDRRVVEFLSRLPHDVEGQDIVLNLKEIPLVPYTAKYTLPKSDIESYLQLKVASKILEGTQAGASSAYTPEQVASLKEVYLTPALNFSPPTTTEYTDLQEAIRTGKVDSRISVKVDVGTLDITGAGKLKSGNEYLQRRFTLTLADGTVPEKPVLTMLRTPGWKAGVKVLSSRTKLDAVDTLSYPVYESFLGLGNPDLWKDLTDGAVSYEDQLEVVNAKLDALMERVVVPVAFYIGATGLLPDFGCEVPGYSAETLTDKYPAVSLSKAEKEEGTFYVLPDGVVIAVYTKSEHFSV